MTEDELVGWHHRLNGHEFEQALGVGDGQGGLAFCSPWDRKESDRTAWLDCLNNIVLPLLDGQFYLSSFKNIEPYLKLTDRLRKNYSGLVFPRSKCILGILG